MEIKGESGTELRICIVSLAAVGAVLSSGYETVPRIYSCHFRFANLVAEWRVSASPPRRQGPRSLSSAAAAGSLSRACLHLRKDADTEATISAAEAQMGMIQYSGQASSVTQACDRELSISLSSRNLHLVEVALRDTAAFAGPVLLFVCISHPGTNIP